jgi:hypothetical protein
MLVVLGIVINLICLFVFIGAFANEFKWAKVVGREPFHENNGKWQPGAQTFLTTIVLIFILFIFIASYLL